MSKVARPLLGGNTATIAKSVLGQDDVKEGIIKLLLWELNEECTNTHRKTTISPFRTIPVDHLADFQWKDMVNDLQLKAPPLHNVGQHRF